MFFLILWLFWTLKKFHISSQLSNFPFLLQIYSPIRFNFGIQVFFFSISRQLMPQTVLRVFDFWTFLEVSGPEKMPHFLLISQNFYIHSEVIVQFSPNLVCNFVDLIDIWCWNLFEEFSTFENFMMAFLDLGKMAVMWYTKLYFVFFLDVMFVSIQFFFQELILPLYQPPTTNRLPLHWTQGLLRFSFDDFEWNAIIFFYFIVLNKRLSSQF